MSAFLASSPVRRVEVTGADRVRYLDDVTTQRLGDVPVTHVRGALVLDQHGAPVAMFDVVVLGDRLSLLVPDDEVAAAVLEVLGGRTFLLDARFTATDDEVVAVRGDEANAVIAAAGLTVVAGRCRMAGDLLVVAREGGVDLVGARSALEAARAALREAGAVDAGAEDLERWRIERGEPAWGREVVAPHLPEEYGLLASHVHLAKGCYPGQETVARMWMLGRPRRRLAVVAAGAAEVLEPGWRAGSGRRAVVVTSASPDGDRALAYVPAEAAPGDRYEADDGTAVVVERLVGGEQAPPGHDPAVIRRRDRSRD